MTRRINIDKRIYDRFYAAPNDPSYVCNHILAEYLEVPVKDLIAALERHGFTSEPVTHEGHDYLKLTRSDGVDFTADWNHAGSNYYDGLDIETGTMSELRWLPYQLQDPTLFCALWWSRKAHSGEQLPRLTRAWSLMESKGQEDIHPDVLKARAEKAEKERLAGLDAENAKLKEELAKPRWTMEEILLAFGEVQTWDSCYIDEKTEGEAQFSFEMYMSDLMAGLLRQKGLPEDDAATREVQAQEAVKAAWARVLRK